MKYQDKERQALAGSRPSALVYGDVDLNLLDGSAIWLQSVTQALVAAGCAVTLVLKAPVRTDRLVAPLRGIGEVTIRSPHVEELLPGLTEASLTVPQAVELALITAAVAVAGAVIVLTAAHGISNLRWWTFGLGAGLAGVSLVASTVHELTSERVRHELEVAHATAGELATAAR